MINCFDEPLNPPTAAELARFFHETYEELAPSYGYETRKESAVSWENVPEKNKKLMTAVCRLVIQRFMER